MKIDLSKIERVVSSIKERHPRLVLLDRFDGHSTSNWLWRCSVCNMLMCRRYDRFLDKKLSDFKCDCNNNCSPVSQDTWRDRIQVAFDIHKNLKLINLPTILKGKSKATVYCDKHDYTYKVDLYCLSKGMGCFKCGCERTAIETKESKFKTTSEIVARFQSKYGDRFDYSEVDYKHSHEKVKITCKVHGSFYQMPHVHMQSKEGCPSCTKWGFDINKPANLYLQLLNDKFIKFGITNNNPYDRLYNQDRLSKFSHDMLNIFSFMSGKDAKDLELEIKHLLSGEVSVVAKEDMKDGYTETTYLKNYTKILRCIEDFKKKKKGEI